MTLEKCSATIKDNAVNFKGKGTLCNKKVTGGYHSKEKKGDLYYFACGDHKAALGSAVGLDDSKWMEIK